MSMALIGGAKDRLLPASIPYRFFGAALLFHFAAWGLAAAAPGWLPDFAGGLGPPLAALHLLTLGTLATAATGAAFQLLPVAVKAEFGSERAARATSWLLIPGVPVLTWGMGVGHPWAMTVGASACAAAFVIFAAAVGVALRRASGPQIVIDHGWAALAALAVLATLGVLLVGDFTHGYLGDHRTVAVVHLTFAAYGFLGLLALGFSQVLIPMFALAPNPPVRRGYAVLALAAVGLALAAVGAFVAAAAVGLAAAALHVGTMAATLRRRVRKGLGPSFALLYLAWAMLPLSLALGGAVALGWLPAARGGTLFGFVLVAGWLLSFVAGILMRILPFLASLHAAKARRRMPRVADLSNEGFLWAQVAGHAAALVLVGAGIAAGSPLLIRIGAVAGMAGAGAFILFALDLFLRVRDLPGLETPIRRAQGTDA